MDRVEPRCLVASMQPSIISEHDFMCDMLRKRLLRVYYRFRSRQYAKLPGRIVVQLLCWSSLTELSAVTTDQTQVDGVTNRGVRSSGCSAISVRECYKTAR